MSDLASNEEAFYKKLDYFEYLLGLKYACEIGTFRTIREGTEPFVWGPVGSFGWRGEQQLAKVTDAEITQKKSEWFGFKSQLFINDNNFRSKKDGFDRFLIQLGWNWRWR